MENNLLNPRLKLRPGDRFHVRVTWDTPNSNDNMRELDGHWLTVKHVSAVPIDSSGDPCPDFVSKRGRPVGYEFIVSSVCPITGEQLDEGHNYWFWYHMDAIQRFSGQTPRSLFEQLPDI